MIMKKLFAVMLALCLMLGTAAMADELVWAGAVEEAASQMEGEFHTFDEIAVKIWIPAVLEECELSDEDKEEGYIGYFQTADETAAIGIQYVDMSGTGLEAYAELLKENGIDESSIEAGTVNGIECLSYANEDNGVLAFATQKGYILEVAAGPMTDEGFQSVASIIFSSIQAE